MDTWAAFEGGFVDVWEHPAAGFAYIGLKRGLGAKLRGLVKPVTQVGRQKIDAMIADLTQSENELESVHLARSPVDGHLKASFYQAVRFFLSIVQENLAGNQFWRREAELSLKSGFGAAQGDGLDQSP
jgi:hypothetical protein